MDTNSVWEFLSSISIGTVLAWILVILSIFTVACTGTVKLYKVFIKYKKLKDENEKQKEMLIKHDNTFKDIEAALRSIQESLDAQKGVTLKNIRYTIVQMCDEAIAKGSISVGKLRSLEELYDEYINIYHANGYVKVLVNKTRKLDVTGSLDE